jgi:DNA-binding NarL/FixJ family response regulator
MNIEPTIKVAFIDDHDLLRKGICEFLEKCYLKLKNGKSVSTKSLF